MKKYEYMIVYCYSRGIKRARVILAHKISSYEDIKALDENAIEQTGDKTIFVMNFKLLREYRGDENGKEI